jgi:hypothetical protein
MDFARPPGRHHTCFTSDAEHRVRRTGRWICQVFVRANLAEQRWAQHATNTPYFRPVMFDKRLVVRRLSFQRDTDRKVRYVQKCLSNTPCEKIFIFTVLHVDGRRNCAIPAETNQPYVSPLWDRGTTFKGPLPSSLSM